MLANSADADEPARNEPSHQDLHILLIIFNTVQITLFEEWDSLKMLMNKGNWHKTFAWNILLSYLVLKGLT